MDRPSFEFRAREKSLKLGVQTRLMGIVNITPDSFSDGGSFVEPDKAVEHCLALVEEGADILDLGGQSSRPGSQPVSDQEEVDRLLPVLEKVRPLLPVMISIDTYKVSVARTALEAGADIVNDISAFRFDKKMPDLVNQFGAGVVLMHMRGEPSTMHQLPPSDDIFQTVYDDLRSAANMAYESNINRDKIILDPGIGFGKNAEESLQLINRLPGLQDFQLPVLVGTSRKSFIGKVLDQPVGERLLGTVASSLVAVLKGAHILRVHDVEEVGSAVRMADAIASESLPR
jgi:dihydropteroate synthase